LLVVIAAVVTIWVAQGVMYTITGTRLVTPAVSYLVVLGGLAFVVFKEGPVLGIRWPRMRFVIAAMLIGAFAWFINLVIVSLVQPPGEVKTLEKIVDQAPLGPTIIALGVLPAITEELVFRGALARSLAARYSALPAILISAALFGAYHMVPVQMLPTFLLGLALGFVTLRAGSVVPAMIMHFMNNTIAIVISREEIPAVQSLLNDYPLEILGIALASVALGITIAARGTA